MPTYKVIQYRDACQRYEVEIDAATPQAALDIAKETNVDWQDCGVSTYDNADMEVQDSEGNELIATHNVW